jgi:hypothetical protein
MCLSKSRTAHPASRALTAYLESTGLPYHERERKVVVIVSIDERVSMELGYQRGGYGGYLAVGYSPDGRAEFRGQLPPAAALIGLVRGLFDSDSSEDRDV